MEMLFECGKLMVIVEALSGPSTDNVSVEGSVMYMSGEILYSFKGNSVPASSPLTQIAHDVLCHLSEHDDSILDLAAIDTNSTSELRFLMTAY